jgi:hypothetical protein
LTKFTLKKAGDTMKLSIENLGEQNSKVVAL